MQSKRSFFNRTLFRKNLTRYWPLWGGLSIAGALIPLYIALVLMTSGSRGGYWEAENFAEMLYVAATVFAPAFIMGYAIICAMLVWNYLYSPRAVGLMHTLPVDRTCLFITNAASGMVMMAIPFAVVGALTSLVALLWGFFHPLAVLNTILAVVFMIVLFFGLATLCAMLTGHTAVLPVLYLLVNFIAEILEVLVSYLVSRLIFGMSMPEIGKLMFLSPVMQIYRRFQYDWSSGAYAGERTIHLIGLGTVALYGLAGIVLLALSWLLYRKRQSERAGDIVAYRPLRPVFRYGIALISALTLGQLLELLWEEILYAYNVSQADLLSMIICMALTGIVGYYIASMLLEKSLRVFRGSWKGVLAVCAGSVVLCGAVSMDPVGMEDRIPDLDEIASINFSYTSISTDTEEGRKLAEDILDIHRSILEDKAYINRQQQQYYTADISDETEGNRKTSRLLPIYYTLKDGSQVQRQYGLIFTESRMSDETTYDGKFYAFTHSKEIRRSRVAVPEGSFLRVSVYAYGSETEGSSNGEKLYEALLQDAEEGNLQDYRYGINFPWWEYEDEAYQPLDIWLEILYLEDRSDTPASVEDLRYSANTIGVDVNSKMEHTLAALVEDGYFTSSELQAILDGVYVPNYD